MLKLIKWDFIDYAKRSYWLYLAYAAVLAITAVLPDDIRYLSALVDGVGAVFGLLFYGYTFFLSATEPIGWLRKGSTQLELSLPVPPWKVLLSKLILAFGINVSGLLLTELLWSTIDRYGMSRITWFADLSIALEYAVCLLMLLICVMLSYIAAKSFSFTRNRAGFVTALLTLFLPTLLIGTMSTVLVIAGAWDVSSGYPDEITVLSNGSMTWFESTLGILGAVFVICAGFWASCRLLQRRFERYQAGG